MVNIKKSIVLKDYPVVDNLVRSNVHIGGCSYTTRADPDNKGKIITQLDSYSSTDAQSRVGITIVKPTIKLNCKTNIKVNMDEAYKRARMDSIQHN